LNDSNIKLSLAVLMSFFIHLVLITGILLPDLGRILDRSGAHGRDRFAGRDIIVNINQDNKRERSRRTLLSDRDSAAKGFITQERGDRWLNNSLDFTMLRGKKGTGKSREVSVSGKKSKIILHSESEVVVLLSKKTAGDGGDGGTDSMIKIPDRNSITRKNAIFYSNTGMFSFNTAKFRNFRYFKSMKDRIASNWHPPLMANVNLGGYAPGSFRIRAIPSQEVKVLFTMDRQGNVLEVKLVDSYGNKYLDSSCVDAIVQSRSFGKVPDDIKGEIIGIPFIFGYYAY